MPFTWLCAPVLIRTIAPVAKLAAKGASIAVKPIAAGVGVGRRIIHHWHKPHAVAARRIIRHKALVAFVCFAVPLGGLAGGGALLWGPGGLSGGGNLEAIPGASQGSSAEASPVNIPEPSSMLILLAAIGALLITKRND